MDLGTVVEFLLPYLPNLLAILFVVALAKLLLGSTGKILQILYKHFKIPRGYYLKVRLTVRLIIVVTTLLLILLAIPGVDQTVIALIGIAIGVLVSLSSTTTIGNAVAGAIIYFTRPIREGDRVEIDGVLGDVVSLELLFVHIKTVKDEIVSIPALRVLQNKIINYSALDHFILHVNLTLGYELDPGKVEKMLLASLSGIEEVLEDPKPFVLIRDLKDYTVEYELNCHTAKPQDMLSMKSKIMRNIIGEFTKEKVQIMSPAYVNLMEVPCPIVMPDKVSRSEKEEDVVEDHKKEIVNAKKQILEKRQADLKLKEK